MRYKNLFRTLFFLFNVGLCLPSQGLYAQNTELPQLRFDLYTKADDITFWKMVDSLKKWGIKQEDSATRVLEYIYTNFRKRDNLAGAIRILVDIAVIKMDHGRYAIALRLLNEALELCTKNPGHEQALVAIYIDLGNVYNYMADYKASASAYFTALDYYDKYPVQNVPRSYIYNNLASTLFRSNQKGKAMQMLRDAYREAEKEKDSVFMANIHINLGSCYYMQKDYQESEQYYRNAVVISARIKAYDKHFLSLLGLGNVYKEQSRYDLALECIQKAHELMNKHPTKQYGKNYLLSLMAEIYVHKKDFNRARLYYRQAIEDTNKTFKDSIYILAKLGELYYAMGDYKKAYDYKTVYELLDDSISNKEIAHNVNELDAKYRSAEKDKEIFESRLLLSEQKVKLNNKNLWILGISSLALILMAIGGAWVVYRNKKNKIINNVIKLQSRIEGEEQERMRISHELHDGVNSQLTAVKSFMIAAQDKFSALKHLDEFNTAKQILSETATEIRNIAHSMAPGNLLNIGLASAIRTFCDKIFMANNIHYNFETAGDVSLIEQNLALNIYRIVQELCNNIVKHARATSVTIICSNLAQEVLLIVEDNGKGLSENYLQYSDGMGLKGVRERVAMFQGVLLIESEVNKNTTFSITFDLHKAVPKTS